MNFTHEELLCIKDALDNPHRRVTIAPQFMGPWTKALEKIQGLLVLSTAVELPEGWEATADGVSTTMILGDAPKYTRKYIGETGTVVEAPCSASGNPVVETLIALTQETPQVEAAEA